MSEKGFNIGNAQSKNTSNLLKVLGSKDATKALTSLGKTDKSTWKTIDKTFQRMNEFVSIGGTAQMFDDLKQTVDLKIAEAPEPLL